MDDGFDASTGTQTHNNGGMDIHVSTSTLRSSSLCLCHIASAPALHVVPRVVEYLEWLERLAAFCSQILPPPHSVSSKIMPNIRARCLLAVLSLLGILAAVTGSRTVTASLSAPWASIPSSPVLEASEIISDPKQGGERQNFWTFLKAYVEPEPGADTPAMSYEDAAVSAGETTLSGPALDVFRLAINVHSGAPLVQLHDSIAREQLRGQTKCADGAFAQVVVDGKGCACSPQDVAALLESTPASEEEAPNVTVYDFDHVYPIGEENLGGGGDKGTYVVLYGTIGERLFHEFHDTLVPLVESAGIQYLVRHAPFLRAGAQKKTFLKGFGVTLDLKSMEYKALDDRVLQNDEGDEVLDGDEVGTVNSENVDDEDLEDDIDGFVFSRILVRRPRLAGGLRAFREHLLASASDDSGSGEIKVWDMKNLGLQAAQKIMKSKNRLWQLQNVAQNFPVHAKALTKMKVRMKIKKAVKKLHAYVSPGESGIKLNGRDIDPSADTFDYFEFLQLLREEAQFVQQFRSLGLTSGQVDKYANILNRNTEGVDAGGNEELLGMRVDTRTGAKGAVFFINNIEKDKMYRQWPRDFRYLMQHAWNLIQVRYNLYTSVFVIDPLSEVGLETLRTLFMVHEQQIPLRVGLALVDSSNTKSNDKEDAVHVGLVLKLLATAKKKHKIEGANGFLAHLATFKDRLPIQKVDLIEAYAQGVKQGTGSWSASAFEDEANRCLQDEKFDGLRNKVSAYAKSKGLSVNSYTLNGAVHKGLNSLQSSLMQVLFMEQQRVQRLVSMGQLSQKKNIYAFMTGSGKGSTPKNAPWAYPRLHSSVMVDKDDMEFVEMRSKAIDSVEYVNGGTIGVDGALLTFWVIADLSSSEGVSLCKEAIKYASDADARVAIFSSVKEAHVKQDFPVSSFGVHQQSTIKVAQRENVVIGNGRVFRDAEDFDKSVFQLIDRFERKRIMAASKAGLIKIGKFSSDHMMEVSSVANRYILVPRQKFPMGSKASKTMKRIIFRSNPDSTNGMNVVVVLDPLSIAGQRFPPILTVLRDVIHARITVYLNPKTDISEFPLKNFYRYVGGGNQIEAATFRHLPPQHILTMKIFTPEPWVVMTKSTIDDLDNIRLDDEVMGSRMAVSAEFELINILVTGRCEDLTHRQPPNGLQLVLDNNIQQSKKTDTLVMQNLGYFQLQAMPGVYHLRLARGRASGLYSIAPPSNSPSSLSSVEDGAGVAGIPVTVQSFSGSDLTLRVRKKKGMEGRSLLAKIPTTGGDEASPDNALDDEGLDEEEHYDGAKKGLWGQITNIFSGKENGAAAGDGSELETLHVFSLASGHLYERLLRIMMLSVRKRTSGPLKFWIVENFLSPQFKETIQYMATEFGFDVGLVTYKWPHWLRRQTEKQRIIWGYKILFLDVLFPLNVPKIITVDADQVVRADLRELWNMDLQGAPYAYTPFCTSREETLGYQFWRDGFWKNHLGNKPYHISALYVVDLVRFRRMAAGDQLRSIYDQLSRDPNSLANLDQDLPNYAQHSIPIFSLPQEWLWCQSWCSDSTLKTAKTIDLCNHPKTKEAKLDMAKRIISGEHFAESWIELDKEVQNVVDLGRNELERTCAANSEDVCSK